MQKYPLPLRATRKQSAEPNFQENNVRIEAQGANLPKGVAAPCGVVCESSLRKEVIQHESHKTTDDSLFMLKNR